MDKKHAEMMSGLLDGELDAQELDALMQQMADEDARADWDLYLHIGAALRAEEAVTLRPGFAARVAAQLAAEPAHEMSAQQQAAPVLASPPVLNAELKELKPAAAGQWWQKKRLALLAGVTAACAALGLVGGSQLMLASNEKAAQDVRLAAAERKPVTLLATTVSSDGGLASPMAASASAALASDAASVDGRARLIADGKVQEMLRDPEIDQYLLAHQRFSPSLYSAAQYARSATFATDKDK